VCRPALETKQEDRDVAVVELDPLGILALGRDTGPRAELEHALEPARGAGGIGVVERDAQTSDLSRNRWDAVPLSAPLGEPTENLWPEEESLLPARDQRLGDTHWRATFDRVEAHVDPGVVHEAAIREPHARLPDGDPPELERIPARVVVDLQHAAADTGLDPHRHRPAGVEEVDRAAHPPAVDLVREGGERAQRFDGDGDARGGRRLGHDCSLSST
jgi:hypothetical protein